jgi:hypothetical protein
MVVQRDRVHPTYQDKTMKVLLHALHLQLDTDSEDCLAETSPD